MRILVTGTAGFIGFHLAKCLLERGDEVVGLDIINDYYDVELKYARLRETGIERNNIEYSIPIRSNKYQGYSFIKLDLQDRENIINLFESEKFDNVCHLAAQAGVRYSLTNPYEYINSNIVGFINILECCRHYSIKHLTYASSSSIYGLNEVMPFRTSDNVDHPISLYAASKKSNELMAHVYSYLFNLSTTGLRFFTVYGPWGRPDMALFLFTKAILEDREIDIYNYGNMQRDFTYILDIIEGIKRVIDNPSIGKENWTGEKPVPGSSKAPYKIYNIGNSRPVQLMDFIYAIEKALGKKAQKKMLPMQPGDVIATYADISDLKEDMNYEPHTSIEEGIEKFIQWYMEFYNQ